MLTPAIKWDGAKGGEPWAPLLIVRSLVGKLLKEFPVKNPSSIQSLFQADVGMIKEAVDLV